MNIVRFATFNAALFRPSPGQLIAELRSPDQMQARKIAAIIQHVRPDVLLLQEFDYDATGHALALFHKHYLEIAQPGMTPISYPWRWAVPSNTGIASWHDLDGDGRTDSPGDALGYGAFPGQYAFALLSRYPLQRKKIRSFQHFLWQQLPDARLPVNPEDGRAFYSPEQLAVLPLSSKNHVDIPVILPDGIVHILAAHPTPPAFDGAERRNHCRNADEIRLLADYLDGSQANWLCDDQGHYGGLPLEEKFVLMGDLNADSGYENVLPPGLDRLLNHPRINPLAVSGQYVPVSQGAVEAAEDKNLICTHPLDRATAAFKSKYLRVDYVLPSQQLPIKASGVFWPTSHEPLHELVKDNNSSDHRLVWMDVYQK